MNKPNSFLRYLKCISSVALQTWENITLEEVIGEMRFETMTKSSFANKNKNKNKNWIANIYYRKVTPTRDSSYLFLLFLLLWRSLIWIAAASWVWAVWGRKGGGRGRWGRAVIVAVTAAVTVIRRRTGGVAAVWWWVTGGAVWVTAAVTGIFSPELSGTAQRKKTWVQKTEPIVVKSHVSHCTCYSQRDVTWAVVAVALWFSKGKD